MADVTLHDPLGVGAETMEAIISEAKLPHGSIFLFLGDSLLEQEFQAVTIARAHIRFANSICGLADHVQEPWECGVLVGERWTRRQSDFPAYFAYLVAHEFGHATTVLSDIELTCFEIVLLFTTLP